MPSNKSCCVPQCGTQFGKCVSELSMHRFPRDDKLREVWKNSLKITREISNSMVLCSLHFRRSDFFLPKILSKRNKLKPGAVPSQCLPTSHEKKLTTLQQGVEVRNVKNEYAKQDGICKIDEVSAIAKSLNFSNDHTDIKDPSYATGPKMCNAKVQVNNYQLERFNILNIVKTDSDMAEMSGISTCETFYSIVESVKLILDYNATLPVEALVLLVFMKMKLNFAFDALSVFFTISEKNCKRYFRKTVFAIAEVLQHAIQWPNTEEVENTPFSFRNFKDVVVVLDCMQIPVEKPHCKKCRKLTYSRYNRTHTLKILIGVTPAGLIPFVSEVYGGRASKKQIMTESNILELLTPNVENHMPDKVLYNDKECLPRVKNLVQPPFLKKYKQIMVLESLKNVELAEAQVQLSRAIQRFQTFSIFNKKLDWEMVSYINSLKTIAAGVINLSPSILDDVKL